MAIMLAAVFHADRLFVIVGLQHAPGPLMLKKDAGRRRRRNSAGDGLVSTMKAPDAGTGKTRCLSAVGRIAARGRRLWRPM